MINHYILSSESSPRGRKSDSRNLIATQQIKQSNMEVTQSGSRSAGGHQIWGKPKRGFVKEGVCNIVPVPRVCCQNTICRASRNRKGALLTPIGPIWSAKWRLIRETAWHRYAVANLLQFPHFRASNAWSIRNHFGIDPWSRSPCSALNSPWCATRITPL